MLNTKNQLMKRMEEAGKGIRFSTAVDVIASNPQRRIDMSFKHTANEYNQAAEDINLAAERVWSAAGKLAETEKDVTEKAKALVSRSKDLAGQIGDSLGRVNRILGPDFESRLNQLERMSAALTNLAELERNGSLQSVMKAMGGTAK